MRIDTLKRTGGTGKRLSLELASVLAVGLAGLALRCWGLDWSLLYVDLPDEPTVMAVSIRIVEGQANPDFFLYPSLMFYLHALVLKLHFWWVAQAGVAEVPASIPTSSYFYTQIPGAFTWARVLTATLGAATVLALATWGARFVGRAAALLLALSPWAIAHSHFVTVDIPSAFFGTLAQRNVPPWVGLSPLDSWQPGALVVERLDLWLPDTLPPGRYSLWPGLYDSAQQLRYGDVRLPNDELSLGAIEVLP